MKLDAWIKWTVKVKTNTSRTSTTTQNVALTIAKPRTQHLLGSRARNAGAETAHPQVVSIGIGKSAIGHAKEEIVVIGG